MPIMSTGVRRRMTRQWISKILVTTSWINGWVNLLLSRVIHLQMGCKMKTSTKTQGVRPNQPQIIHSLKA
jgi:hypothetical protein